MDFSFNEEQVAIKELANQIFSDRLSDEYLLKFYKEGHAYDQELWSLLAEQGLLGIAIKENMGGSGLGLIELCLLLEEAGRNVAPVPLLTGLLSALVIERFADEILQNEILPSFIKGEAKISLALSSLAQTPSQTLLCVVDAGKLSGKFNAVLDASVCDYLIVEAEENDKRSLYLVDVSTQGVTIIDQHSFSGGNFAQVKLVGAKAKLIGEKGKGEEILYWLEERANVLISALSLGVCEEATKRTALFTAERNQFGVPLASFQAVAMRAADAYIDCEAIRSVYWGALWRLSEGLEAEIESRAAKYWASKGAHKIVHAAQHLHGGMGSDIEYPIHRFFIMAKQLEFIGGNGAIQLEKLGQTFATKTDSGLSSLRV